jgi:hypothetical protein
MLDLREPARPDAAGRGAGPTVATATLNGAILNGDHRRAVNVSLASTPRDFADQYDFDTLFYDAFYVQRRRAVCLICPPLLNFQPGMERARFWSEGAGSLDRPVIRNYKRFSEVWLHGGGGADVLHFCFEGQSGQAVIGSDETKSFAGLNCAAIKSKDNDLRWVRDWTEYHVRVHGLQGLVFFDNASSRYGVDELVAVLSEVEGLRRAVVIPAPYKFGVYSLNDTMFLQVGLLNIARLRFLSRARAVLCLDLDELVAPTPEGSVFDTAMRTPFGYLVFEGCWREAMPGANEPVRHSDHVFEPHDSRVRNTKYCICPGKLAGGSHWDIHGAIRGRIKKLFVDPRVRYWHCRQISTGWNRRLRQAPDGAGLRQDETTSDLFRQVFVK